MRNGRWFVHHASACIMDGVLTGHCFLVSIFFPSFPFSYFLFLFFLTLSLSLRGLGLSGHGPQGYHIIAGGLRQGHKILAFDGGICLNCLRRLGWFIAIYLRVYILLARGKWSKYISYQSWFEAVRASYHGVVTERKIW